MTPEKRVAAPSDAWLRSIGAYVFKPVQMGMGATTLDRLVCFKGQFIGIEYKAAGIVAATPRQQHVMREIAKAGGIAFLSNSLERTKDYIMQHALHQYNPETGE